MKFLFLLFCTIILIFDTLAQMNSENINKAIEDVRLEFAPDNRIAVFNITYSVEGNLIHLSGETNSPQAKSKFLSLLKESEIVDQINLLPSKDLGTKIFGIVNLSVADIRTKPEHSAELATQVTLGSRLKVLKANGGWYLVQCEDEYIGWIEDDGLFLVDKIQFEEWNFSKKIVVTAPFTFTYIEKNAFSTPVSDVVNGNLLKLIEQDGEYVKVEFPDGREAFILNSDIQDYETWLNSRVQSFDAIKGYSYSLMGLPYVWGGTSIKGVDCSGFTKIVFRSCGVELPRDASQQVNVGEPVDTHDGFSNLLPGDLLFFGTKDLDSKKERITHVAIYLGHLEFIHSSGRVRINSLDKTKANFAENRLKTFIKAKRILSSVGKNGVKLIKH